ncbi:hypothetical protein ACHAW6_001052 [Cyclotella cf. meneghiniana]
MGLHEKLKSLRTKSRRIVLFMLLAIPSINMLRFYHQHITYQYVDPSNSLSIPQLQFNILGDEVWKGTPLESEERSRKNAQVYSIDEMSPNFKPFNVCSRTTNTKGLGKYGLLRDYSNCHRSEREMILLNSPSRYGRTGNSLIEFLRAVQLSRERNATLGIISGHWIFNVLSEMFLAIQDLKEWEQTFERLFCVKIIHSEQSLEGWNITSMDAGTLFWTTSNSTYDEYVASTQYSIRALMQGYNRGNGTDMHHKPINDMCSGINAIFGNNKSQVLYSVVHSRNLMGAEQRSMGRDICNKAHCDPLANQEMKPDNIKSILAPLGMLKHPVVFITDGEDASIAQRLMNDTEIGPLLRFVPDEARWVGGDITLGIMGNVFIGNPVSSYSGFITKSRLSLGLGHSYLFRAINEKGEWITSCGDGCIFDKNIVSVMS